MAQGTQERLVDVRVRLPLTVWINPTDALSKQPENSDQDGGYTGHRRYVDSLCPITTGLEYVFAVMMPSH